MPFIRILQDLSPQLKKQKDEYVEGAESGDLFFAKTKDLLPKPVEIIPCYTQSVYTEWVPRSKGGGFVATHPLTITSNPSYERGRERQYDEWLGENELRFTTYWFVLVKIGEDWDKAIIPFTSSQLRVSRKLVSDINRFRYEDAKINPPLFAQNWTRFLKPAKTVMITTTSRLVTTLLWISRQTRTYSVWLLKVMLTLLILLCCKLRQLLSWWIPKGHQILSKLD